MDDQFDTVIIGSGIAATALSERLLSKDVNASILILEAGQKVKMQDSAIWQDYVVSGKLPYTKFNDEAYPERDAPGQNMNVGKTVVPLAGSRVMTFGGSTIHWGGWSFRLKEEDFKMKTNTGSGADWPIDYADLEPYYGQAEDYIGVSGDSDNNVPPRTSPYPYPAFPYTFEDQPMATAMEQLNITHSHLPIARHGIQSSTSRHAPCKTTGTCKYCPFGARYAATNFLSDMTTVDGYPNLEVRINCVVERIEMASKLRADAVVYFDKTKQEVVTVKAKRVIVAGGAIESPKLLQRSKSKFWKQGIGNDLDLVGRYFITHPYFFFTGTVDSNDDLRQPEMNFPTLCTRYYDSKSEQAQGKFMFINPPGSPDVDIASLMQAGNSPEQVKDAIKGPNTVELQGMVEIFSEYDNKVSNYPGKINQMGLSQTIVDYSQSPTFDDRMVYIQSKVEAIFESMNVTMVGKYSVSWRADHAACTCRMSKDASEGVTDKNMKVHGVDNVYVCSNAAFTSTGAINPTLTLAALSLRLGDYINNHLED